MHFRPHEEHKRSVALAKVQKSQYKYLKVGIFLKKSND